VGGSSSRFESDSHILDFGYVETLTLNLGPLSALILAVLVFCFLYYWS
jgi:hypothetical protein